MSVSEELEDFRMERGKILYSALLVLLLAGVSCQPSSETATTVQKTKVPEIKYIAPEKPPKIKLKYSKGHYSWTIEADSPEKVIKADRTLREYTMKAQK